MRESDGIAKAPDAPSDEGKRFFITYGAGHKYWFLEQLRRRDDIILLDAAPFLDLAALQSCSKAQKKTGARRPRL